MPNFNNLIDKIQQNINTNASSKSAFFSPLNLKYAYSLLNLEPEISLHCTFNIVSGEYNVSGECTGTNRFIAAFYGLT